MSMLLVKGGMLEPLRARADAGMPVFGTCAGMILCSSEILDGRDDQHRLGAIPLVSRRNGYGRQIDSFEADLAIEGFDTPFHGVFIQAPIVDSVGDDVVVLAEVEGQPVLCQHGPVTVASFHPELSGDVRLHRRWLADAGLLPSAVEGPPWPQRLRGPVMSGHSKWATIKHKKGAASSKASSSPSSSSRSKSRLEPVAVTRTPIRRCERCSRRRATTRCRSTRSNGRSNGAPANSRVSATKP